MNGFYLRGDEDEEYADDEETLRLPSDYWMSKPTMWQRAVATVALMWGWLRGLGSL